jgi:hypothetical protein
VVKLTWLYELNDFPIPDLELLVHLPGIPGAPGAGDLNVFWGI